MSLIACPHCHTRVFLTSSACCPSCRNQVAIAPMSGSSVTDMSRFENSSKHFTTHSYPRRLGVAWRVGIWIIVGSILFSWWIGGPLGHALHEAMTGHNIGTLRSALDPWYTQHGLMFSLGTVLTPAALAFVYYAAWMGVHFNCTSKWKWSEIWHLCLPALIPIGAGIASLLLMHWRLVDFNVLALLWPWSAFLPAIAAIAVMRARPEQLLGARTMRMCYCVISLFLSVAVSVVIYKYVLR